MKFDELDQQMRIFETAHDHCVLPDLYIVARIDGRNFTRLTKELLELEAPFDLRFRDWMASTVEHLMNCGLRIVFGYTQSDEISLLCHRDESSFGRKTRKLNSVLAGEASACFTHLAGHLAAFDCRICELPTPARVRDYFRWRQEDAARNALNAHCYWMLRHGGDNATAATRRLRGMSVADKNELLFQKGINFNDLPAWQKRGVGFCWEEFSRAGVDPRTGEPTSARRRRIHRELELPMREEYERFILDLLMRSEQEEP